MKSFLFHSVNISWAYTAPKDAHPVMHLGVVYVCVQSCLTLSDPMDCSPPGSSVHGILQAKYWSGPPFLSPGELPQPGIKPTSLASPALAGGFFTTAPPRKPLGVANDTKQNADIQTWLFTRHHGRHWADKTPRPGRTPRPGKTPCPVSPLKESHFLWRRYTLDIRVFMMIISAMLETYSVLFSIYQETCSHLVTQGKVFFQREEIIAELGGCKRANKLKTERTVMNGNDNAHLGTLKSAAQGTVSVCAEDCAAGPWRLCWTLLFSPKTNGTPLTS